MIKKHAVVFVLIVTLYVTSSLLHAWQNWPGNHQCQGEMIFPKTKNELIDVVMHAASQNRKIHVVGSGHSLNGIACCDDYLISLSNLTNIISVDRATQQVTVEAGISLQQFNRLIAEYGLALPNLISIYEPTLAGAICTASHGTGHTGTLSSFIVAIELITADGTVHTLSLDNDREAFEAASVSLGSLGVIYSITMQCEPLFLLEYNKVTMGIDDIVAQYELLQEENEFFQFRWNTQMKVVTAEFWNRVPSNTAQSESIEYSFESLACDKNNTSAPVLASEIAIPVAALAEVVAILKDFIEKWSQRGLEVPHINGRFVKADMHAYLSPSANVDVIYFNMSNPVDPRYYEVYQDFEQLMYPLGGRPHWGKNNFMNYEKALTLYGENFLKFIAVKKRFDPQGIFSNPYLDHIFVP